MTATVPPDVQITAHARRRWDERFPRDETVEAAFSRAARVTFVRLREWAKRAGARTRYRLEDEYRHDPVTSALFVLSDRLGTAAVVTVIPFERATKRRAR